MVRAPSEPLLRTALLLVLLGLRLDRGARLFPVGVGPGEELGERRAVGEPAGAVERDRLAGEPVAAVGHEEGGEVLQLVALADAFHRIDRRGFLAGIAPRREALAGAFSGKDARGDGVEAYAVASPLDRERLRHDVDAGLGHRR